MAAHNCYLEGSCHKFSGGLVPAIKVYYPNAEEGEEAQDIKASKVGQFLQNTRQ